MEIYLVNVKPQPTTETERKKKVSFPPVTLSASCRKPRGKESTKMSRKASKIASLPKAKGMNGQNDCGLASKSQHKKPQRVGMA